MKEKILSIYEEYKQDGKRIKRKLKRKYKKFKQEMQEYYLVLKEKIKNDLKNPKTRRKYIAITSFLLILNLLIVSIFSSYSYYNNAISFPLVKAQVGNIFLEDYDYVLFVYLENANEKGEGSNTYHLADELPVSGYTYSGYKCQNGSTLNFDEQTLTTSVTITEKEFCSIYFDIGNNLDLTVNIMLEDKAGSDTYTLSSKLPAFGYLYSHSECTNGGEVTYDSERHKLHLETNQMDYCKAYFKKVKSDISLRLYVENTYGKGDYVERNAIPMGPTYSLNTQKSYCNNVNNERMDNSITYEDGYIMTTAKEIISCSAYLNRNE